MDRAAVLLSVMSGNDGEAVWVDAVVAVSELQVSDDRVLADAELADRGAPSMRAEGHGLRGDVDVLLGVVEDVVLGQQHGPLRREEFEPRSADLDGVAAVDGDGDPGAVLPVLGGR